MSYFQSDYPRVDIPAEQMPQSFEDWIKLHNNLGHIDFTFRIYKREDGKLGFYVHTAHLDSITYNIDVDGNELTIASKPSCGRIGDYKAAYEQANSKRQADNVS